MLLNLDAKNTEICLAFSEQKILFTPLLHSRITENHK